MYCLRNLRLRQNIVELKVRNSLMIYLTDNLHKEETKCLKLTIEKNLRGSPVEHSMPTVCQVILLHQNELVTAQLCTQSLHSCGLLMIV